MSFYKSCKKHKMKFTECRLDGTENKLYPAYGLVYNDGDYVISTLGEIGRTYAMDNDIEVGLTHSPNATLLHADDGNRDEYTVFFKTNKQITLEQAYALYTTEILMNCNGKADYKIYGLGEPVKVELS